MNSLPYIKVFDNILTPKMEDEIYNIIFHTEIPYTFLYNIIDASIKDKAYVGMQHILYDFEHQLVSSRLNTFLLNILYKTSFHNNMNITKYYRGRVFIQPPLKQSVPSQIHTDLPFDHLVCLYYVNDVDGDTIFFDDNNKEIQRVSPKKGRVAIFNGKIPHCSTSPMDLPRGIINFNFE